MRKLTDVSHMLQMTGSSINQGNQWYAFAHKGNPSDFAAGKTKVRQIHPN